MSTRDGIEAPDLYRTAPALTLTSVKLENWKSFSQATLHLAELSLLIGANASGKSNALEALRLLAWLATGARLGGLVQATRDGDLGLRGSLLDLNTVGGDAPCLRFECSFLGQDPELGELRLALALEHSGGELRVVEESLDAALLGTGLPLYRVVRRGAETGNVIQVEYNNFARGGRKPIIPCVDNQAVFTQLTTPARFAAGHDRSQTLIPRAAESVRRALEGMLFLDPVPAMMRGYADKTDHSLRGDGANVSSVLYHLCGDPVVNERLLAFIRALPEEEVTGIHFINTPRAEVMVQLEETFGGTSRRCDAPLLSDGTLRVLSIAAALFIVRPGSLVVIEEIDNGVHPSRAAGLLDMIREVARDRELRVVLTTHNPALLDALPTAALPNVTVCYRNRTSGHSELVRLGDLERHASLLARGPLGQLVTQGLLERHLKNRDSKEERIRKGLEWVDVLMRSGAEL